MGRNCHHLSCVIRDFLMMLKDFISVLLLKEPQKPEASDEEEDLGRGSYVAAAACWRNVMMKIKEPRGDVNCTFAAIKAAPGEL